MATYTLAQLVTLTASHLRRDAEDGSAMLTLMQNALNRHRREIWRRSGGPDPAPTAVSLVAGTQTYTVTGESLTAVSVLDAVGNAPRFLKRYTLDEMLSTYPDYPGDGTANARALPAAYRVYSTSASLLTVSLYPIPSASVTSGLAFYSSLVAADLSGSTVSPLPPIFDETAAWAAAEELTGYIDEDMNELAAIRANCQGHMESGMKACRLYIESLDDAPYFVHLANGDNFGHNTPAGSVWRSRSGYSQPGY